MSAFGSARNQEWRLNDECSISDVCSFVERSKKMRRFVVARFAAVIAASVSLHARGGTLCYGESEATIVDVDSGTRTASLPERIRFSTGWVNGAGADAVLHGNRFRR